MGQEPLTYTPQAPQALQLHVRPWLPEPEGRRFRVNSSESLGLGARIRATRSLALRLPLSLFSRPATAAARVSLKASQKLTEARRICGYRSTQDAIFRTRSFNAK